MGLTIAGLGVRLGPHLLVDDVSLQVEAGTVHCLVGDSGSGKTMTSLAAVGLLPYGSAATGRITLADLDENLVGFPTTRWPELRGRHIGYVGQNALGCLHPAYTVEFQLVEAIRRHQALTAQQARDLAIDELAAVDLSNPGRVAAARPAELSGGMCQRVALAIALCNRPDVLIADEPTTALDDETQENILALIRSRAVSDGLGVLLITHDRQVVDDVADDVTSIRDGVSAPGREHTATPARPRTPRAASPSGVVRALDVSGVSFSYGRSRRQRRRRAATLQGISLSVDAGTTAGLVGRSGAGKTTLARVVAGILEPSAGEVVINGHAINGPRRVGRCRKADLVQYVFQDPFGSLNPRRSAIAQVAEPLVANGSTTEEAHSYARTMLIDVGLTHSQLDRRPTELSGGQCQRVGIARALIRRPSVVVLDEPVSALDWSIRAEILSILGELQEETGAAYLLIAHDRPLIDQQCDAIYEIADSALCQI
jgi:peptide/nickel transport system ATP-binding protein